MELFHIQVILAQVVVALAESPKSIRVYKAYGKAKTLVDEEENYPVSCAFYFLVDPPAA